MKNPGGRPSKYSPELAKKICKRISAGESLRSVCRDIEMPCLATVFNWLFQEDKRNFLEQYERARACQAEHMFDELLEIADLEEDTNKARLKIDTRKWYLSKVLPKKFGERSVLTTEDEKGNTKAITGVTVKAE